MCCCKGGGYKIGDKWIRSGLNSRRSADHNQIISWWSAPILALPKPHIPQILLPLLRHYASLTLRCSSTSTTSQKYEGSLDQTHNCASFSHKILTPNLFLVKQKIKANKLWNYRYFSQRIAFSYRLHQCKVNAMIPWGVFDFTWNLLFPQ